MGKCIYSHDDGAYCDKHDHGAVTVGCCGEDKCPDRKALTHADRIRAMADEELAEFFQNTTFCDSCFIFKNECGTEKYSCKQRWLDWLKQEAKDD